MPRLVSCCPPARLLKIEVRKSIQINYMFLSQSLKQWMLKGELLMAQVLKMMS